MPVNFSSRAFGRDYFFLRPAVSACQAAYYGRLLPASEEQEMRDGQKITSGR